jgi:hypothetical protein
MAAATKSSHDNDEPVGLPTPFFPRYPEKYGDVDFSTLNHNLSYCYDASRAIRWLLKQAAHGFQGTTGSFED